MIWNKHYLISKSKSLSLLALTLGLFCYFSFHIMVGEHGLDAHKTLSNQLIELQQEHDRLKSDSAFLTQKVKGLSFARQNPDLVDEVLRASMNYSNPTDLVIVNKP